MFWHGLLLNTKNLVQFLFQFLFHFKIFCVYFLKHFNFYLCMTSFCSFIYKTRSGQIELFNLMKIVYSYLRTQTYNVIIKLTVFYIWWTTFTGWISWLWWVWCTKWKGWTGSNNTERLLDRVVGRALIFVVKRLGVDFVFPRHDQDHNHNL